MNKIKKEIRKFISLGIISVTLACVKDSNHKMPPLDCVSVEAVNTVIEDLFLGYQGKTKQIQEDLYLEGFVVSSDKEGNFFGSLHIQDKPANPSRGIQIQLDLFDSHLFFPPGSRMVIRLQGLYCEANENMIRLGGVFEAFGSQSVGRLPAAAVPQHLFLACEPAGPVQPTALAAEALTDELQNTLVRLEGMEIIEAELGLPFAPPEEEVSRTLQDCKGISVKLLNSGYANFAGKPLPDGNGSIIGILTKSRNNYQLVIRDTSDLDLIGPRCNMDGIPQESSQLFISEIADPDNNPDARFLELFYAGSETIILDDWEIRRYTNSNTEVSSSMDLSGQEMEPNSTLVIASDAGIFEAIYGFPPHLEGGSNGPADSNGDDTLELVGPSGERVDIFGVIGEDGSGTDHEFEDGGAWRRPFVQEGNQVYTFEEWEVYNDSGLSGTHLMPKNAPEDFSPGMR